MALLQKKKELENEIKVITKVNAQFACFLKTNAVTPYNDAVLGYLDHLISVEKDKVAASGKQEELKRLQELRSTYSEEIKVVQTAIDKGGSTALLRPDYIKQKIYELHQLKHAGPQFSKIMATVQSADSVAVASSEKVIAFEQIKTSKYPIFQYVKSPFSKFYDCVFSKEPKHH